MQYLHQLCNVCLSFSIQRKRDYYSKNPSILNISSYNVWNLSWDAKIPSKREIMMLFHQTIKHQIFKIVFKLFSWSSNFSLLLNFKDLVIILTFSFHQTLYYLGPIILLRIILEQLSERKRYDSIVLSLYLSFLVYRRIFQFYLWFNGFLR